MWTAAARASVLVMQLVPGALLITVWLLGKVGFHNNNSHADQHAQLLTGTGIVVAISLAVAGALLRRTSPTAQGIGLSTATSAVLLLIGAVVYVVLAY